MIKQWLFLAVLALILALWLWPKTETFPKKVHFGSVQVKPISGRKIDNFEPTWRQNMTKNRRISQLEKLARQMGMLAENDYLDVTTTAKMNDNKIMALARKHGLVQSGEWIQVI